MGAAVHIDVYVCTYACMHVCMYVCRYVSWGDPPPSLCCFCFAIDPAPHAYHLGSSPYLVAPLHPAAITKGPSRAPCRYSLCVLHHQGLPFSVPPLLAYWTLLQNRIRDLQIHSLLPEHTSSIRGYGTVGLNGGCGAGFDMKIG